MKIQAFLDKKVGTQAPAAPKPAVAAAPKPATSSTAKPIPPASAPSKPVPKVRKVSEATLPKMKGSEKPEEKKIDDMEVF